MTTFEEVLSAAVAAAEDEIGELEKERKRIDRELTRLRRIVAAAREGHTPSGKGPGTGQTPRSRIPKEVRVARIILTELEEDEPITTRGVMKHLGLSTPKVSAEALNMLNARGALVCEEKKPGSRLPHLYHIADRELLASIANENRDTYPRRQRR